MTTTSTTNFTAGITYRGGHLPSELPELNLPLLADLLEWAEVENEVAEGRIPREQIPEVYRQWGMWDQGVWGFIINPEDRELTEEDKRQWRNGICETAFCMAGQAACQSGYRMVFGRVGEVHTTATGDEVEGCGAVFAVLQRPTGQFSPRGAPLTEDVPGAPHRDIAGVGQEVLGLTTGEAHTFFEGDNRFRQLCRMANTFCSARNLPPLYPGLGNYPLDGGRYVTDDFDADDDDDEY